MVATPPKEKRVPLPASTQRFIARYVCGELGHKAWRAVFLFDGPAKVCRCGKNIER